jgi:hypothetical protein
MNVDRASLKNKKDDGRTEFNSVAILSDGTPGR